MSKKKSLDENLPLNVRRQRLVVRKEGRITIPQAMRKYHGITPQETVVQLETIRKGKLVLEVIG